MQAHPIKKHFITLFALAALGGCADLSATADYEGGDYGIADYESFYKANPDLIDHGHKRVTTPSYILVDWNDFSAMEQRYLNEGYVRIGTSGWRDFWGSPERAGAINYAKKINADRIICTEQSGEFDPTAQMSRTEHKAAFYARAS